MKERSACCVCVLAVCVCVRARKAKCGGAEQNASKLRGQELRGGDMADREEQSPNKANGEKIWAVSSIALQRATLGVSIPSQS